MAAEDVIRPDDFFCLRTPLLPQGELRAWSAGLAGADAAPGQLEAALARDRALLRARLGALVARPEILEALYVATPDLVASLDRWRQDPDGERGRRVEAALVRYFSRMCHRSTPFGLFAGVTTGLLGEATALTLPPRAQYRARLRLDTGLAFVLAHRLQQDGPSREQLVYRTNTSLYACGGRLRYTEARVRDGERQFKLAAIAADAGLERVLARAGQGARLAELAAVLVSEGHGLDDAMAYVHALAKEQVIVPDLGPSLTGADPVEAMADSMAAQPWGPTLTTACGLLRELEGQAIGQGLPTYVQVKDLLAPLAGTSHRALPWRVDLFKPGTGLTLGPELQRALVQGVRLLQRVAGIPEYDPLKAFRQAFQSQYDQRWVPLGEALDPEFGPGARVGLVDGLAANPLAAQARRGRHSQENPPCTLRDLHLCRLLCPLVRDAATVLELTEADLDLLASGGAPPPGASPPRNPLPGPRRRDPGHRHRGSVPGRAGGEAGALVAPAGPGGGAEALQRRKLPGRRQPPVPLSLLPAGPGGPGWHGIPLGGPSL